jgi:hypothetical protein
MTLSVTVSVSLVSQGEYRLSIPLAPSPSPAALSAGSVEGRDVPRREDKVLPLGSSTLSPGLRLPVGG